MSSCESDTTPKLLRVTLFLRMNAHGRVTDWILGMSSTHFAQREVPSRTMVRGYLRASPLPLSMRSLGRSIPSIPTHSATSHGQRGGVLVYERKRVGIQLNFLQLRQVYTVSGTRRNHSRTQPPCSTQSRSPLL